MKENTRLVHIGRDPKANHGIINQPVYRLSTVLYPSVQQRNEMRKHPADDPGTRPIVYGTHGSPASIAFENAIAELEGGHACFVYCSGLAAIVAALLSCLRSGDHMLVSDSVYSPMRRVCDGLLKRIGVSTTYFPPTIGSDIRSYFTPQTKVLYLESPGSYSFDVQDIPALAEQAHKVGAKVIMDNTWATPLWFKSFSHGVDLSVHAATKYICGHSDVLMGTVTANRETAADLQQTTFDTGQCAGPDDVFLAARGLRTMKVRMLHHQKSALAMAEWLAGRDEVKRVLYPALPGAPGHDLWRRDFLGATGLFSIILHTESDAAVAALVDGMKLFGFGDSWGGFESLITISDVKSSRTAEPWLEKGKLLRLHIGLEDVGDLQEDMDAGFARMKAV